MLEALAKLNMSGYEWRTLLVLLGQMSREKKPSMSVALDLFVRATLISKPHVCRALNRLEERGLITRMSFRGTTLYTFITDSRKWSDTPAGDSELDKAFDKWMERYPVPIRKGEAKAAFCTIVQEGEATVEQLEDALTGYLNFQAARDARFKRRSDPLYMMIAANFLKDKKYEDYIRYKDMKDAPAEGIPDRVGEHKPVEPATDELRAEYDAMVKRAMKLYGWESEDDIDYFKVPTFTEYKSQKAKERHEKDKVESQD